LFKQIIEVEGIIVEAGVFRGGGSMSWAQLSIILEPHNHQRRVVGFDTFEGFQSLSEQDGPEHPDFNTEGAMNADSYDEVLQ